MKITIKIYIIFVLYALFISAGFAKTSLRFEVNGIKGDLLQNVESRLTIMKASYGKELSIEDIQEIQKQSPEEIRKALQPFGYFKPIIQETLTQQDTTWIASFQLNPGPPLVIREIHLQLSGAGRDNPKLQQLVKHFPLQQGDVLRSEEYENAKEELFRVASEEGYIKASLQESGALVDLKKYDAVITLNFQTGERYYFGGISFSSSPYAPAFLRRFIKINENTPFSSQKLLSLQQEMAGTFYFRQIIITPDLNNIQNYRVPLRVTVAAPKARKYALGIGYGTFTGPRLTAGVSFRRLGDSGHHFDAQANFSKILSGVSLKYFIPGKNPISEQWVLGAKYQKFMPKNGVSNSGNVWGGYMKKFNHLQTSINLTYLVDSYKEDNKPNQFSKLLYPSLNLLYVRSDDPINPLFGGSFYFNLQGANNTILSTVNFIQAEVRAKVLVSPASFSHFLFRGNFGYTATEDIKRLPLSMGFFVGGLNTVRGYPDGSVGPGRFLKVISGEYQNKIYGNWNGAIFYDMGIASDRFNASLLKGEGVGLIYNSMIGPIKFYVARAMDKPNKPRSIEFSIGPEF